MRKSIETALIEGKSFLKDKGIQSWSLDGELLLCHILSISRVQLFTHPKNEILKEDERKYKELIYKRSKNVPTQYLINKQEFMALPFFVDENVLIPRPDTENLVETVLGLIDKEKDVHILDMCTGSGCIAVSLAYYLPNSKITAVDISDSALKVAKHNARLNNVDGQIFFIKSNLFERLPKTLKEKIDIIVSNPPYIPTKDMEDLMREVRDYEPNQALDGGEDGLRFYHPIINDCMEYLRPGGVLAFEIGYNQAEPVENLLKDYGFSNIEIKKDLAGFDRVIFGINELK